MKKTIISTLTLSVLLTALPIQNVNAINFEGKEEKYMQLCSGNKLTSSNKATCEAFNTYLKNKNKTLANTLKNQKEQANETADSLEEAQNLMDEIESDIQKKNDEIKYVESAIEQTQKEINQNSNEIKNRMYAMQSYTNDNSFIEYIFGAENFVDMISRIDSYNEITNSDEKLIKKLISQKEQIKEQKNVLSNAKQVLESQKKKQASILKKFNELLEKQKQEIAATQNAIYDYGEATESLSAAIDKFNKEAYEIAVPQAKPEPPKPNKPPVQNDTNSDNTESDDNNSNSNEQSTHKPETEKPSSSSLGYDIYQAALSKLGCRYYWGASGPDYFDCSGFVYWCLNKAGYKVGRTSASGYSRMFSAVSWTNSQTGDLACFGNGSVTHIGIVMLNSDGSRSLIHAGGGDSHTYGNDPNACVKISSFEPGSYYYSRIVTIRRVR